MLHNSPEKKLEISDFVEKLSSFMKEELCSCAPSKFPLFFKG
jgi:hypothetical protein